MAFPQQLSLSLVRHIARQRLQGRSRFPLVLMLEPTFRCNLACAGCGRVREGEEIGYRELSAQECLQAVEEAGAPVVSLTGGEPLLHRELGTIVRSILAQRRFVYLCTNGLRLQEALAELMPSPYFSFVVHLDGSAPTHDRIAGRSGVFDTAWEAIRAARRAGFRVCTNTTVYKGTRAEELINLFAALTALGVDGLMLAPAFGYEQVQADIFLSRHEAATLLAPVLEQRRRFRFQVSPIYLDFLAGKRTLFCRPWSTPTRNPQGWKSPCYLLGDRYCASFQELMDTPWERYGPGRDPRCSDCMMHCGYEAAALEEAGKSLRDLGRVLRWYFGG